MNKIQLLLILALPSIALSQNSSYCDSVFIKCCEFNTVTPNTITIQAANHSEYLFDYPAFVLIDENSDTIAKETVNYFGIGYFFQDHLLEIVNPPELPLSGSLLLYTLFYDTLWCEFPAYIPDTVVSDISESNFTSFKVFPNPAKTVITIDASEFDNPPDIQMNIIDNLGRIVFCSSFSSPICRIPVSEIGSPGMYFIRFFDKEASGIGIRKLIIE